jgi:hypothetical protein
VSTIGRLFAVAEFEGDVIAACDQVEAIRNRAKIAGDTFAREIEEAYQALYRARHEIDSWKSNEGQARLETLHLPRYNYSSLRRT